MKQYKFTSRSALSFATTHNGRQMYVSFSPAYRGLAYFITTDEALAAKIRAHRWFRDGRIQEQVVDILPAAEEKKFTPTAPPEPKRYSILGKPMAATQPAKKEETARPVEAVETEALQESSTAIVAEDVTSFMEAKEFFITNYGVQRSDVANKEAVSQLCKQYNVTFPNYPV